MNPLHIRMQGSRAVVALALVIGCLLTNPSIQANSAGSQSVHPVPAVIQESLPGARLAGEGLLRWFGFRVYLARLFVGERFDYEEPLKSPLALSITYQRSFDGRDIANRSADEIASLGFGSQSEQAQWTRSMTKLFPNVQSGDEIVGIVRPGGQTVFFLNQQRLGAIRDPAFGKAFFSIWLDERTSAPELRAELLGNRLRPESSAEAFN